MVAMFSVGIIPSFFVLLVMLLCFAVAKKRSGVALAAGGVLLLCLLVPIGLAMLWMLLRVGSHAVDVHVASPTMMHGSVHAPFSGNEDSTTTMWKVSFVGIIALFGGLIAFIVALLRRGTACASGSGAARWWPLALIPLVPAFFFVGSMESSRHTTRTMGVNTYPTPRQGSGVGPIAQVHDELTKRIATGDIHQLMDQADAPRIVIPEGVVVKKSPKLEVVKIAEATVAPSAEEGHGEAADESHGEAKPLVEAEPAKDEDEKAKAEVADETHATAKQETADDGHGAENAEYTADESHSHDAEDAKPNPLAERRPVKEADERPEWVRKPPKNVGPVQKQVIATDEYSSTEECRRAMDVLLLFATSNHLMNMNGHHFADQSLPSLTFQSDGSVLANGDVIIWNGGFRDHRLYLLNASGIGIDFIRREIAKDEYVQTVDRSVGPMTKLYTLIEFSPAADKQLQARYDSYRRQERFAVVGIGAGSVLGLLGMVWGLFKFDTATKGYYTKRLFLGVPLGILGLFGFYVLLVLMGADLPH